MPKFSISEVTTHDWSFVEDVRGFAAAGIQGIGVWRDKLDRCEDVDPVALLAGSGLEPANLIADQDVESTLRRAVALARAPLLDLRGRIARRHAHHQ